MHLTKELFVIPYEENFILYAPLKGAVAEVNGETIRLLNRLRQGENVGELEKRLSQLKKVGIITDGETPVESYVPKTDFSPTSVTLIPGLSCNFKCVYCYSSAGENDGKTMDFGVAKSAIDFIMKNTRDTEIKPELVFHGGGEPFLNQNMILVRRTVEYFKRQTELHGLTPKIAGTTNGFMSRETLEWIVSNFDSLTISLDGPEDIQNKQRPTINGGKSFHRVMETVNHLESTHFKYGLRASITKNSVSKIPEIVEFFCSISSAESFALEPIFECGRCATTNEKTPDSKDYINYLIKSREIAKKTDRVIHYSGSIIEGIYDCFCSSLDTGFFCVLPDGDVTSCLEVCRESDPRRDVFITGKYDFDSKEFVFYMDRIQKLRSRNIDNIDYCKDCYAKYNCAGDCPSKCLSQSGSLF